MHVKRGCLAVRNPDIDDRDAPAGLPGSGLHGHESAVIPERITLIALGNHGLAVAFLAHVSSSEDSETMMLTMSTSISVSESGRSRQKARTRAALVQAARTLL